MLNPEPGFRIPPPWQQDSCGQTAGFHPQGEVHFTHRGNALHPMGEIFTQDSSRKPYKNHTIRPPAGFPFSPHREV